MSKGEPWLTKMDRAERAKQFMPFAALKGYEEALRAKEAEVEARMEAEGRLREYGKRNAGAVAFDGDLTDASSDNPSETPRIPS